MPGGLPLPHFSTAHPPSHALHETLIALLTDTPPTHPHTLTHTPLPPPRAPTPPPPLAVASASAQASALGGAGGTATALANAVATAGAGQLNPQARAGRDVGPNDGADLSWELTPPFSHASLQCIPMSLAQANAQAGEGPVLPCLRPPSMPFRSHLRRQAHRPA